MLAVQMLSVVQLTPNDWNPNRFDEAAYTELVAEVRKHGDVPKPVVVRPLTQERYEIVDGEHGWRAAGDCGLATVSCQVIEADDFEAMTQTYKRNQHGVMDPVATGRMFQLMKQARGLSNVWLSAEMGVAEGTVRNYLRYAEAAEPRNGYEAEHAERLAEGVGQMTVKQVRQFSRLTDEAERRIVLDHVLGHVPDAANIDPDAFVFTHRCPDPDCGFEWVA